MSIHATYEGAVEAKKRCEDQDLMALEDQDSAKLAEEIEQCGEDPDKRRALWAKYYQNDGDPQLTVEYLIHPSYLS